MSKLKPSSSVFTPATATSTLDFAGTLDLAGTGHPLTVPTDASIGSRVFRILAVLPPPPLLASYNEVWMGETLKKNLTFLGPPRAISLCKTVWGAQNEALEPSSLGAQAIRCQ
jgi:hypothetical protein